jgi:hypothetical protein
MKTRLAALSLGLALAASIYLLVWPVYSGFHDHQPANMTLVAVNGPSVLIPVMFPVLVAALPLLFRKQVVRVVAAILIGGFSLVAMSIGLLYLPAAIVMMLATCVADSAKMRDAFP